MDDDDMQHAQRSAAVLAGALTYLAQHLANDGSRSAFLAAILFGEFAADESWSAQLRDPAREIAALLERCPRRSPIERWQTTRKRSPEPRTLVGEVGK